MFHGLLAGVLWGLDTVILGVALAMTSFVSTEEAIVLAPFVSTFIHDACSALWMFLYMAIKKELKNVWRALKSKSGKFIVVAALLGAPIGMTGYVAAINYIGPGYTAIISALFPAIGAVLSYIFLKEYKKHPVNTFTECFYIFNQAVLFHFYFFSTNYQTFHFLRINGFSQLSGTYIGMCKYSVMHATSTGIFYF